MKFDVTINTDDNYIQHAMATLCSLFENNKDHEVRVHVLENGLSPASKLYLTNLANRYDNVVYYYQVDEDKLEGVQFRKNRPLSKAAYYRLLLSSTLPSSIHKVLYLDCDIIVLRDISEIFHLELEGYALAATLDNFPYDQQHRLQLHMEADERTFCSGVMLVNLDYWREHAVEDKLLEYAKRHREVVYLHDQDVLNYYFKKKWFLLPPKWNRLADYLSPCYYNFYKSFDYKEYLICPMLYHYASFSVKPWYNFPCPEKQHYMRYLSLSGYKDIQIEKKDFVKKIIMCFRTFIYNVRKCYFLYVKS